MTAAGTPGESATLDGRYRLLRRLGSGGMAVVWAAHDERLGRDVAVKVLSDVLAADEGYRRRFEREARLAAGLSHPGLVGVLDFGAESERPYLVMELVSGDTLARRIAEGTTAELDVRALAGELLAALAHIHAEGIVHRDVKPANVLVAPDGRARLTDFGIARPRDATALTRTGEVIGTISYMAPEVQRGEPATPRSDLYSLGMVLRECGGEHDAVVAPLIARLTASHPGLRPASAEKALAELSGTAPTAGRAATEPAQALAGTRATAVLAGAEPGPRPAALRRPRPVPAALVAALLALAAVALVVALAGGDDEPRSKSAPPAAQEPGGASGQDAAEPAPAPKPTQDEPAADEPTLAADDSCAAIEQDKKGLEEEKKAAEEAAGNDKEAKKAISAEFEARKKELEERAQDCEG